VNAVTKARLELNRARRAYYALSPRQRERAVQAGARRRERLEAQGLCICCGAERFRDRRYCRTCLQRKAKASAAATQRQGKAE